MARRRGYAAPTGLVWVRSRSQGFALGCISTPRRGSEPGWRRAAGCATCHIGKWHLGGDRKFWPEHQGSEVNIGGSGSSMPRSFFWPAWRNNPPIRGRRAGEYLPGQTQTNAIYAAMVDSVNQSLGRVLGTIDERWLAGRTIVFFLSENGGPSHARVERCTRLFVADDVARCILLSRDPVATWLATAEWL